jgi:hypothetical protein
MDSKFPIVPGGANRPIGRGDGDLVRPRPGSVRPQPGVVHVHQAGEMRLYSGGMLRPECWGSISERTRNRLNELAGDCIEWFARQDPSSPHGRCYAVVFGDRGLAIARPRLNTDHRPVYVISAYVFAPASLRHVQVDHCPRPYAASSSSPRTPTSTALPTLG